MTNKRKCRRVMRMQNAKYYSRRQKMRIKAEICKPMLMYDPMTTMFFMSSNEMLKVQQRRLNALLTSYTSLQKSYDQYRSRIKEAFKVT